MSKTQFEQLKDLVESNKINDKTRKILLFLEKQWKKYEEDPFTNPRIDTEYVCSVEILLIVQKFLSKMIRSEEKTKTLVIVENYTAVLLNVLTSGPLVDSLVLTQNLHTTLFLLLQASVSSPDIIETQIFKIVRDCAMKFVDKLLTKPCDWAELYVDLRCKRIKIAFDKIICRKELREEGRKEATFFLTKLKEFFKIYHLHIKNVSTFLNLICILLNILDSHNLLPAEIQALNQLKVLSFSILPCIYDDKQVYEYLSVESKKDRSSNLKAIFFLFCEITALLTEPNAVVFQIYYNDTTSENLFTLFFNVCTNVLNLYKTDRPLMMNMIGKLTASLLIASSSNICWKKIERFMITLLISSKNTHSQFLVVNCWLAVARASDSITCWKYFQLFFKAYKKSGPQKVSILSKSLNIIVHGFYVCLTKKRKNEMIPVMLDEMIALPIIDSKATHQYKKAEEFIETLKNGDLKLYKEAVFWINLTFGSYKTEPPASLKAKIKSLLLKIALEYSSIPQLKELVLPLVKFADKYLTNDKEVLEAVSKIVKFNSDESFQIILLLNVINSRQYVLSSLDRTIFFTTIKNKKDAYEKFTQSADLMTHYIKHKCVASEPPKKKAKLSIIDDLFKLTERIPKNETLDTNEREKVNNIIKTLSNLIK